VGDNISPSDQIYIREFYLGVHSIYTGGYQNMGKYNARSPGLVEWLSYSVSLPLIKLIMWIFLICPAGILMIRGFLYVFKRECVPESLIILSLFTYPSVIYIISVLLKPMLLNEEE
jgi:hypothetical protein